MADFETVATTHDGTALEGRLLRPAGPGPHPAVLVMATAMGIGDLTLDAARLLADQGYAALATDMYGGGVSHVDDVAASGVSFMALFERPGRLRERVVHWFETVKTLPGIDPDRIAAIGYCFGGQCVLELARSGADVKLVVSYHGLLTTEAPAQAGGVKAQVAVFTGRHDPYAPQEHVAGFREEMIAADARWHITELGNSWHSFTDPQAKRVPVPGVEYDELARNVSWAATLALLKAVF